jgi:hypothetical protein
MGHAEPFERDGKGGRQQEFLRGILIDLCGERDTGELSRELNGRTRVETNRDFGPLSQELGRLVYGIDEGSLRKGEILSKNIF